MVGDFNGDGLSDLMYFADNHWNLRLRKGQRGDLVSSITAGYSKFNDTISIDYQPLTQPEVYSKGGLSSDERARGLRSFQGAVYVTSDVRHDNATNASGVIDPDATTNRKTDFHHPIKTFKKSLTQIP